MDRQVGKQHGTGKKSPGLNQSGHCLLIISITSELVSRVSGSNSTCRPEWVTGWKETDRTAGWSMPNRMMSPTSWSLRSRSTAATRVTVSPASAQLSSALRLSSRKSLPRMARWVASSKPSNCK
ncbi:hypothetical protein NORO109296_19575 [Nocardiopsis rhodophaea]